MWTVTIEMTLNIAFLQQFNLSAQFEINSNVLCYRFQHLYYTHLKLAAHWKLVSKYFWTFYTVPLSYYITVISCHCHIILLSYHITVISLSYHITIISYHYHIISLSYHCHIISLSYHITVISYHIITLSYNIMVISYHCHIISWSYNNTLYTINILQLLKMIKEKSKRKMLTCQKYSRFISPAKTRAKINYF